EDGEITELLLAINKQIRNEILALLDRGLPGGAKLKPDTARRLRERDRRMDFTDITPLLEDFRREVEAEAKQRDPLPANPVFALPTAVVVIDRYTLQHTINDRIATEDDWKLESPPDNKYVRVGLNPDPELFKLPEFGAKVTVKEFKDAEDAAYQQVE